MSRRARRLRQWSMPWTRPQSRTGLLAGPIASANRPARLELLDLLFSFPPGPRRRRSGGVPGRGLEAAQPPGRWRPRRHRVGCVTRLALGPPVVSADRETGPQRRVRSRANPPGRELIGGVSRVRTSHGRPGSIGSLGFPRIRPVLVGKRQGPGWPDARCQPQRGRLRPTGDHHERTSRSPATAAAFTDHGTTLRRVKTWPQIGSTPGRRRG